MIEIVMDQERNLKNLKQIGTPREENKIYIENLAYSKIREDSYQDKRIFVLMGHTERMEGRYATFVEMVIPVREPEFSGNVPQWNNSMWSQVFRDIKRTCEDMIIVGWAVDLRGMSPKVTPELERAHREHFGGAHQVLFLLDTMERDETFYIHKENRLVAKDGFYIYYRARKSEERSPQEEKSRVDGFQVLDFNKPNAEEEETKTVDVDISSESQRTSSRGRYRQMMQQQRKSSDEGNVGVAIAAAMLVFIITVGIYENRDSILGSQGEISTEADAPAGEVPAEVKAASEEKDATENTTETETAAPAQEGYVIPVEPVSGT